MLRSNMIAGSCLLVLNDTYIYICDIFLLQDFEAGQVKEKEELTMQYHRERVRRFVRVSLTMFCTVSIRGREVAGVRVFVLLFVSSH